MITNIFTPSIGTWLRKNTRVIFNDDKIMMSSLPYYSVSGLFVLAYLLITDHAWALLCILNVGVPLLDEIFPLDIRSPSEKERQKLLKNDPNF